MKWIKKCSKCGKTIRYGNKSGLCSFHYHQEYYSRPEVRARIKLHNQKPEVRLKKNEDNKRYYSNNKDKFKNHYQDNKVELAKKSRIYYEKNKDKILEKKKESYKDKQKPEIVTTIK